MRGRSGRPWQAVGGRGRPKWEAAWEAEAQVRGPSERTK